MLIKNKTRMLCVFVIAAIASVFLPKIYRSHVKLQKIAIQKRKLMAEKIIVKKEIDELEQSIIKLEDDYFVEMQAREKLKMKKKGETIYRLTN